MKLKNILLSCVLFFGSLTLSGCYTQLSMFQPKVDDREEFYQYSSAGPLKSVGIYAQDGSGTSLGMAYQLMYNRFRGFMGFGNRYNYYNPYYYGGYYNDYYRGYVNYNYNVYIPVVTNKDNKPRNWVRGNTNDRPTSNLRVTRSSQSSNNNSSTSSTRSSSSSSTSSNSGTRVTKRN